MGRRTKLTPQLQETLRQSVAAGLPYETACELAGIGQSTFFRWLSRGEAAQQGRYREFWEMITHARAEAEQVLLNVVRTAAEKGTEEVEVITDKDADGNVTHSRTVQKSSPRDWRAAVALLERRDPEKYGKRVVKHEGIPETANTTPVVNLIFDDGESQGIGGERSSDDKVSGDASGPPGEASDDM